MSVPPVPAASAQAGITIRPMQERDLATADRVMRLAFGTFLGLPEPTDFLGDASYVHTRWLADPSAAFVAEAGGELVGSNFAANWGSVGFFGPLSVRPDLWDRGVAQRLLEPVMACFDLWGTQHAGLFTFPHSQKHLALYQKFGFWPRFLTMLMSRPLGQPAGAAQWTKFSALADHEREEALLACARLTDALYAGLDVGLDVRAVAEQGLGETVLLWDEGELAGFAVCHCGAGSEAGSGTCYVKFGAVRPSPVAERDFDRLLDACEALAREKGLARLSAGVNTARLEAYRRMLERGFRTDIQGVVLQRAGEPGYNRPGVYLLDDWR